MSKDITTQVKRGAHVDRGRAGRVPSGGLRPCWRTCMQCIDKPGPVYNFLWHMWHLKCFAFWCWIKIFSSSNSLLQYLRGSLRKSIVITSISLTIWNISNGWPKFEGHAKFVIQLVKLEKDTSTKVSMPSSSYGPLWLCIH